jgi:GntR family transcriptional repressor for pyruvate dehydrogenase complex
VVERIADVTGAQLPRSTDGPPLHVFEPIETTRTFEAAIEHVLEGIERARIRSGERLPNERVLAQQLNISIPTLGQALRVLQSAGVVELRRGQSGGVFLLTDLIPVRDLTRSVRVEEATVVDLLEGRRVLETAFTLRAVEVAQSTDYTEIERSIVLFEESQGNRDLVMRADALFHRSVARATHNRTVEASARNLMRSMSPVRDMYSGNPSEESRTLEIHRQQLRAIRHRHKRKLLEILDEHFSVLEDAFASSVGRSWEDLRSQALEARQARAASARPLDD